MSHKEGTADIKIFQHLNPRLSKIPNSEKSFCVVYMLCSPYYLAAIQ